MNKEDRIAYLRKKRSEFQKKLELQKKQDELHRFISELNILEPELARVRNARIDLSNIASPLSYKSSGDPQREMKYRTAEDVLKVKEFFLEWLDKQGNQQILIKAPFLFEKNDWVEINAILLSKHFKTLFDKLRLLYTSMVSAEDLNFLRSFEFEAEVFIYHGNMSGKEILYHP